MTRIASLAAVFETLSRLAVERRDDVALVSPRGQSTTFGTLNTAVTSAAVRLRQEGMQRGDAVLFSVRPSVEAITLILATALAGGTIVAADPGMGAELFEARASAVRPRFAMAESLLYALSASRLLRRLPVGRRLQLPHLGRLPDCRFVRVGRWLPGTPASIDARDLMAPLPAAAAPPFQSLPDDPVFIVFTSGTTADPRAVVHTARSIAATLDAMHLVAELDERSVVVTDQLHSALPALLSGSRVVLPRIGAGAAEFARLLHRSGATHAFAVPSDSQRLAGYCEQHSVALPATLRQLVLGSGPAGRLLLTRIRPLLQDATRVLSIYGLTEFAPVACVDMLEKIDWDGAGDLVGAPMEGCTVRIDEQGQLCVSGERLCARYFGGECLTEVATGDLARLDDDGRIVLLGRLKDMIIRGRSNIYPALYEDGIAEIPGVSRCALIGVWDSRLGDERVVLAVEPAVGEKNTAGLRRRVEHALQSHPIIDSFAVPDEIVITPLPESGRAHKVDRNALRKTLGDLC